MKFEHSSKMDGLNATTTLVFTPSTLSFILSLAVGNKIEERGKEFQISMKDFQQYAFKAIFILPTYQRTGSYLI